jgi:Subtilase family
LRHFINVLRTERVSYTAVSSGGPRQFRIPDQNVRTHSEHLLRSFATLKVREQEVLQERSYSGLGTAFGLVLEFESSPGYSLKLGSIEQRQSGIRLLNTRSKQVIRDGSERTVEFATVFVPYGKLDVLVHKIEAYRDQTTGKGRPRNEDLVASISAIREAAFEAFWTGATEIPPDTEKVWWELWLYRGENEAQSGMFEARLLRAAEGQQIEVKPDQIRLPENIIRIARATKLQLSASFELLNCLTEIRLASTLTDFFLAESPVEQALWIEDARSRLEPPGPNVPAVCLLDTGVNQGHPLLEPALDPADVLSYNQAWGVDDTYPNGHGTQVAGVTLYRDLAAILAGTGAIKLNHRLESMKLFPPPPVSNEPELYGAITEECTARAEVNAATRKRVFALQVTSGSDIKRGRPSSWSSALDALAANRGAVIGRLFCVSAGNVYINHADEYPTRNESESVQDPAQAWNVLSVGAYTNLTFIDPKKFPDWLPLAHSGDLGPTSSTSLLWDDDWPIKPDLVEEGGNLGVNPNGKTVEKIDSLQLLTANVNFRHQPLTIIGDTSAASGLVASGCAEVLNEYPDLWAETVRALVVHSAEWTAAMQPTPDLWGTRKSEIRNLIRKFGFGVPSVDRAIASAANSVTLITQDIIKPFRLVEGEVKTNEMIFYTLPWPKSVLLQYPAETAELRVTLSYFVEPNPGPKIVNNRYRYASCGLRFDLKRQTESLDDFRKRINKALSDGQRVKSETDSDQWLLGSDLRHHGSIHSDRWRGTAAELAEKDFLGIYPVNGWWRLRKFLGRYDSTLRFSLVVTITLPEQEIDLYSEIATQVEAPIAIDIPT